jgi:hypothetical protein
VRDMPSTAAVFMESWRLLAGHVNIAAHMFGLAVPAGNNTNRWLLGDVIWHSKPATGGNIGWVCTVSSARIAAFLFGPGTWKTFGAIS